MEKLRQFDKITITIIGDSQNLSVLYSKKEKIFDWSIFEHDERIK